METVDPTREIAGAVRAGNIDVVQRLLDAGARPDQMNIYGDTLIDMARDRGHERVAALIEQACERGRRIVVSTTHTDHPIHIAAESGDLRRVHELLDADPSLVRKSDRAAGTALHRAVIGGSREIVALLLDRGADIHAIHGEGLGTREGYAPENLQAIDLAIWGGPRTVPVPFSRWLWLRDRWNSLVWRLTHGRNPTSRVRPCDTAMARLLIARGAAYDLPIAAALGDLQQVTKMLDADPTRLHESRPNGRLALSAAAEFDHFDVVKLLLDRGADPTWPDCHDSDRGAALHAAARRNDRPMVELLLAYGADPNGFVNAAGNSVYAARSPQIRALMFEHGGTVDPYDLVWMNEDEEVVRRIAADPQSALAGCGGVMTAVCTCGKRKLLARLLEMGVKVHPQAGGCHSYLLEQPDMLRMLLERGGLDPNYPTAEGVTLLHELCVRDMRNRMIGPRRESAAILLDAGANISARDHEYRSTPLAWAARLDLPDMAELLLSRGAPTNLPDDEPWATPLAWATRRGRTQIADRLRAAGATH
jgi:ankyrin repeat protein